MQCLAGSEAIKCPLSPIIEEQYSMGVILWDNSFTPFLWQLANMVGGDS